MKAFSFRALTLTVVRRRLARARDFFEVDNRVVSKDRARRHNVEMIAEAVLIRAPVGEIDVKSQCVN